MESEHSSKIYINFILLFLVVNFSLDIYIKKKRKKIAFEKKRVD